MRRRRLQARLILLGLCAAWLIFIRYKAIAAILMIVAISFLVIRIINEIKARKEYKESAYYQITKNSYHHVMSDDGRYGEYITYKYLKYMEESGAKFLFNVYIPKENGETTEIDILMLCAKGIFVFESKNYSGWIFGNENQRNWYQTLPTGWRRSHKEQFYNPVMQNSSHIKHLKAYIGEEIPMQSVIVFSEKCTLKNVKITSKDIVVTNVDHLAAAVDLICKGRNGDLLPEEDITAIYDKLYPCTQVEESVKQEHASNIHKKWDKDSDPEEHEAAAETEEPSPGAEPEKPEKEREPDVENPESLRCPRCGEKLILRTATRGANAGNQFYGCSKYPRCKYIRNITNETV